MPSISWLAGHWSAWVFSKADCILHILYSCPPVYCNCWSSVSHHGLINYIDTKAKCHIKILTCKVTLRQVCIRVYRLEIPSVMLVLTQLCEVLLLQPSLWFTLPPPTPFPALISVQFTRMQCVRGGRVWGSGRQTNKHLPQSPFTGQFFYMTTFYIAFYESYLSTVFIISG